MPMRLNSGNFWCSALVATFAFCTGAVSHSGVASGKGGLSAFPYEMPLPVYEDIGPGVVRQPLPGDSLPALSASLSRCRFPAEDRHLDLFIELGQAADQQGRVDIDIVGGDGQLLGSYQLKPEAPFFAVYPPIPEGLIGGGDGEVRVSLRLAGGDTEAVTLPFSVESASGAPTAGSVALRIANTDHITCDGMPQTVGVPFPRGAIYDAEQMRLMRVNTAGGREEVPVQVEVISRWSRFGSIKWVHLHFSTDLRGEAVDLELEYGPAIVRTERPEIDTRERDGFPFVDGGRIVVDNSVTFATRPGEPAHEVLELGALQGAYVEHENGRNFQLPTDARWLVESCGSERVVLKSVGWYQEPFSEETFCQYIARVVIFRDSPLIRLHLSWIFTGDGNRDRIASMGWRFPYPGDSHAAGILSSFAADREWLTAEGLVQWDYDHYDVFATDGQIAAFAEARAPGVAAIRGPHHRVLFGARDFWENYPSELAFADQALWFHNWPRRNREALVTFEGELLEAGGAPALSSAERYQHQQEGKLTNSEWHLAAVQARFAHEGLVLDFRLPEAFGEDPIYGAANDTRPQGSPEWLRNEVESVNAQGVSRSEEMWLYLTSAATAIEESTSVMHALNAETARVVVDPEWIANSLTLYEFHPQDWQQFPQEEAVYELVALSPYTIREHLGVYGMWLFGDLPAWGLHMREKAPILYRAYRKRHLGWPYPWMPFARSGDPRLFRLAESATRQLIDAGYCHYVDEAVKLALGPHFGPQRTIGIVDRGLIPWASRGGVSTRSYESRVDFLLDAWLLAGIQRASDMTVAKAAMLKGSAEDPLYRRGQFGRHTAAPMKSFVQLYEYLHDPWFAGAARAMAQAHMHGQSSEHRDNNYGGRMWDTADREYNRFSGCPEFADFYLNRHVRRAVSETERTGWNIRHPMYAPKADGWRLTGDEYYLRRVANALDSAIDRINLDPPEPYLSGIGNPRGRSYTFFTPYTLRWLPHALWAIDDAGYRPEPIRNDESVLRDYR